MSEEQEVKEVPPETRPAKESDKGPSPKGVAAMRGEQQVGTGETPSPARAPQDTLGEKPPINKNFAGKNYDLDAAAEKKLEESDFVKFENKKVSLDPDEFSRVTKAQDIAEKYPEGVKFSRDGHPDFSPYSIATVEVPDLTGKSTDFAKANAAAGLVKKPEGYTWHHHEDQKTMLLVPTNLHGTVRHTGGASALRQKTAEMEG